MGEHVNQLLRPPYRACTRENLYQIKRGNNGISLDEADRIVSKFPQVIIVAADGGGQMVRGTGNCAAPSITFT